MNFIKLNIGYKSAWALKLRYHINDDKGNELYYTARRSIWKSDFVVYDQEHKAQLLVKANFWQSKFEIFNIVSSQKLVAKAASKVSIKTRFVVESQTMGWFKILSNSLLKGNFVIVDQQENELGVFTRKLEGFKYNYGVAIQEGMDLLLISSLIILIEVKRRQGAS